MVVTKKIQVSTNGNSEVLDITPQAIKAVAESGVPAGTATLFVVGSTAAITTTEYEPGKLLRLKYLKGSIYQQVAPFFTRVNQWGLAIARK